MVRKNVDVKGPVIFPKLYQKYTLSRPARGKIISGWTQLLDGKIKHQKVVVIKPNYFTQELGLTTCSGHKVTKGIDSNYLEVIKASDFFFQKLIPLSN